MRDVYDFMMNALPWIVMALAIIILGPYFSKMNKEKNKDNK